MRADSEATPPTLVLVGDGGAGEGIRAALSNIRADIVWVPSIDEIDEAATAEALAFVWCAIGTERGFGRAIGRLQTAASIPIYAVIHEDASTRVQRGLYSGGVAGVFSWPREGLLLARYIAEILSLRIVRGRSQNADVALARVIRAHLTHLPVSGLPVEIEVDAGRVELVGNVELLADRDEIEHRIAMVPGVTEIDVGGLQVLPPPATDATIRRACRSVIRAEVDGRTVSAAVHSGFVRFEGTISNRRVLQRLRDLAAKIPGVRGIELAIDASAIESRRARNTQKKLQGLLGALYPNSKVQVAYYRDIAVLEGSVKALEIKRSMQRLIEQDSMVERVVNKLLVDR